MVRLEERIVHNALLKCAGGGIPFKIGEAEVQVQLDPRDTHIGDSPDFILWLVVSMKIFAQNIRVKIPIPIEAEEGGLSCALEDLEKFIEREHFPIELPMLVLASKGYSTAERNAKLPVNFKIKQIPSRLLEIGQPQRELDPSHDTRSREE